MKKILFTLTTLIFSVALFAQEDPEKALNKAGRALTTYNMNPIDNSGKLKEAMDMIEIAANGEATKGNVKTWQVRGEIYSALADEDVKMISLQPKGAEPFKLKYPDAAMKSAESFIKAVELSQKKYETKDALKGIQELSLKLNMYGNNHLTRSDYANSYKTFDMMLTLNDLVKKNNEPAIVPDSIIGEQKYLIAYCANLSGDKAKAKMVFKELYDAGTNEPGVYAQYFTLRKEEGDADAIKILETGRSKFPDNTEILFAEINYYLETKQYEKLEIKLKEAIAKEPNNPSVRAALGNVYLELFNKEFAVNKDSELAQSHFNNSISYFEQAIQIKPDMFDALYSIGSLYFNKAVVLIKSSNDLPATKEGIAQSKKMEEEAKALMNKGLPHFQKAESMEPNDLNTLIALTEIYARLSDFDKSKEFKSRQQVVRDGGKNAASFFKM